MTMSCDTPEVRLELLRMAAAEGAKDVLRRARELLEWASPPPLYVVPAGTNTDPGAITKVA